MNKLADLIDTFIEKNIAISESNGELKVRAPKGVLTPDLASAIRQNKEAIVEYLGKQRFSVTVAYPKLVKADRTGQTEYPLSFVQQRIWYIDNILDGSPQYNISYVLETEGVLNIGIANRAINELIRRHESLRTNFVEIDGVPKQRILGEVNFSIAQRRLTSTDMDNVDVMIETEVNRTFDISKDLLIRVSYLDIPSSPEYPSGILVFVMHHIISDGWSMGVLIREFAELYQSLSFDTECRLSPLERQYVDFVAWQQSLVAGNFLESQIEYWRGKLHNVPHVHSLPLDYPRPAIKGSVGERLIAPLPAEMVARIKNYSRENEISVFSLFHAAFSLIISRKSGTEDIVLGVPVANRRLEEMEPIVGCFINTVVLRSNCAYEKIDEYLNHIKYVNIEAQHNQDVSFTHLIDELKVPRSTAYTPLFQILLSMDTNDVGKLNLPDVTFNPKDSCTRSIIHDLELNVQLTESGVTLVWNYDVALFERITIEQLHHSLELLLGALVENTHTFLSELPVLTGSEIDYQVKVLNDTSAPYPAERLMHQLVENHAEKSPESIAVICGGEQVTYEQLNKQANQLAHYLTSLGVEQASLIGVCMERSMEMVVSLFAILKAGCAYLPLDPSHPASRLEYIIGDSNAKCLLVKSDIQLGFDLPENVIRIELGSPGVDQALAAQKKENPVVHHDLSAAMYLIYTSGSTGKPKGVMVSQNAFLNFIFAVKARFAEELNQNTRLLAVTTISFDIAGLELWAPLTSGGRVIVASKEELSSVEAISHLVEAHRINFLQATPATWKMLTDENWKGKSDLTALVGGEALPPSLARKIIDICGGLWNCYGPTEATVWSMIGKVTPETLEKGITLSGPLNNYTHFILDKNNQIVPYGGIGELHIGGPGLADGYLNLPELTAQRFIANPFSDDCRDRVYKTGDLVRYARDGSLIFIGRLDDQIKMRGFRIELAEIEYHLSELKEVSSSVVTVHEDDVGKYIVAYIIADIKDCLDDLSIEQRNAIISSIKQSLKLSLPDYMIPSIFIFMDNWPLSPNGKIDRKALPPPIRENQREDCPPKSRNELFLADVWSRLLKLDIKDISIRDNFFEIGGHSLLAVRVASEARKQLDIDVKISTIINYSTIEELARYIDDEQTLEYAAALEKTASIRSEGKL